MTICTFRPLFDLLILVLGQPTIMSCISSCSCDVFLCWKVDYESTKLFRAPKLVPMVSESKYSQLYESLLSLPSITACVPTLAFQTLTKSKPTDSNNCLQSASLRSFPANVSIIRSIQ